MSSKHIRILSFDPAITKMGWAVSDYSTETDIDHVVKYGLIKGDVVIKEIKKTMMPEFSKQYTILTAYRDLLCMMIREFSPDYVVTEGAFAHRFPRAYASLTLVIDRIRQAAHETLHCDIYQIPPTEIKSIVTGSGIASKDDIRASILGNEKIVFKQSKQNPIAEASEHEFDAIGAGYSFAKHHLQSILAEKASQAFDVKK